MIIKHNMIMILGAAKCGTTSLAAWLGKFFSVCPSYPKEPQYFSREFYNTSQAYINQYFGHMRDFHRYLVDACPNNLWLPYIPLRVYQEAPNAKLIILVRDPVERAYSDWKHMKNMRPGREIDTFPVAMADNLNHYERHGMSYWNFEGNYLPYCDPKGKCYKRTYLEEGLYGRHLSNWKELFDNDSIYIMDMEQLYNPTVLRNMLTWIGIDNKVIPPMDYMNTNKDSKSSVYRDFPGIARTLKEFYSEDVFMFDEENLSTFASRWGYFK